MMLYPPIILFVSEMLIYIYSVWTSVRVVEFNYIYFVLSVIWRKATKDGINSIQNHAYIFAKMTERVNFP